MIIATNSDNKQIYKTIDDIQPNTLTVVIEKIKEFKRKIMNNDKANDPSLIIIIMFLFFNL